MGFRIVEGPSRTYWAASDGASTYVVGQIMVFNTSAAATYGAVQPMATPSGAADTTGKQVIAGVCVGFNSRGNHYSSTYLSNSTAGVVTQALQLARDWIGAEGMYAKGDPQLLIQVAEITPSTVIRGTIFNAAVGTAPTLLTVASGTDTNGLTSASSTTNACEFTPVANNCAIYCRSGTNAGIYRTTADTSTTQPVATVGFPYDVAIGDTFVRVPFKQGLSLVHIPTGLYLNSGQGPGTANNCSLIIYKLDLATAGKETADFRFSTCHFDFYRT